MAPVVEAADLAKNYGEVAALRGVTLSIDAGEIFALIGPNGAGKTTFVRTLTGAIEPDGGRVAVFGAPPRRERETRIGLLPQAFDPPARLTGREIIAYYGGLFDDARSVDSVLADVGMDDDADRWYERLSGGQQRRICVGTALVNDPALLILDEPTTGIDPGGRRQLWSLLERLRGAGRTVLLTTHDMAEAETLGDRVGLLDDGELVAMGRPRELTAGDGESGTLVIQPIAEDSAAIATALDRSVRVADGEARIDGVAREHVGEMIADLDAEGIDFRRVSWEAPTLEDVFLSITETDR